MPDDPLHRAIDFMVRRQSPEGAWWDFRLDPGVADSWITAYIGVCLSAAPPEYASQLARALRNAGHWMEHQRRAERGWGYNAACPPDSDSTALAVLFLTALSRHIPAEVYRWLASFQQSDGGYATYLREHMAGSWSVSHPDVTPIVLEALRTRAPDAPYSALGLRYVLSQQLSSGLWPSFWWTTNLYGTAANVRVLKRAGLLSDDSRVRRAVCDFDASDAFQIALKGETLLELDGCKELVLELSERLLQQQGRDGGWASAARLRETHRCLTRPWESAYSGEIVPDSRRLFTTATAVRFLGRLVSERRS
jgi:hypothetical protein